MADLTKQEYVTRLNTIAIETVTSTRSLFLKALANAWLYADPSNKDILRRAWTQIVVKHELGAKD